MTMSIESTKDTAAVIVAAIKEAILLNMDEINFNVELLQSEKTVYEGTIDLLNDRIDQLKDKNRDLRNAIVALEKSIELINSSILR